MLKMIAKTIYTNLIFDLLFPDDTLPFGTPYDECADSDDDDDDVANELPSIGQPLPVAPLASFVGQPLPAATSASPQKQPPIRFEDFLMQLGKRSSPVHIYQKIDGCYIRCDILDEKIFDAVVQLKDVHMHRSRYEANLIRARANQRSESMINPSGVRKKFRSARAIDRSKSSDVAAVSATTNDDDVGDVTLPCVQAISQNAITTDIPIRPVPSSPSTSESRARANESVDDKPSSNDSSDQANGSVERRVRPMHMRSPMPKFIVTKVTEKDKSKETVKFDIRNELKIVRQSNLNRSYDSLKNAQKLMRKEISDAHAMVQLQRRQSLRIFNNDDTDATDSDADGLQTAYAGESNSNAVAEPNRWRSSGAARCTDATEAHAQKTPKTIYTVRKINASELRPKTKEQKTELKTKLILHGSTILQSMGNIPPHQRVIIEKTPTKSPWKKTPAAVLMAETTDFESEYEQSTVDSRRKSQRQRQRSKKVIAAAESEPEFVTQSTKKQKKGQRSYVTDVTDFDTDTDGEAFYSAKRRRQPNKKYQDESTKGLKNSTSNTETNKKKSPATPKKPRRPYKPRQRKTPEESKKSPAKAASPRKSKAGAKQNPVDPIIDSQTPEATVQQEQSDATVTPLPSIYNFTPIEQLPDLNAVPHKKSCIGKSKSDVSTKIRTQDMLYSMVTKMMRRFSTYSDSRAPIDLLERVMSQSNSVFTTQRKRGPQRGRRKKRGRRPTAASKKKRPNFTKKLLDSPDFSPFIDIERLNSFGRESRDDDDGSESSDVGDIEQQLSVIRRVQGSLQTVSSPLAHLKLLKAGRTTHTRKSNAATQKPVEKLITRLPLTHLKGMDLLLSMTNNESTSNKSIEGKSIDSRQSASMSLANNNDTNTISDNNAFAENANETFTCESKSKDNFCEIEVLNEPSEMVVEHVYDEEDIESPAFEPHTSNSCSENFEEKVDCGVQQLSKTRVRTKRTRGRIRWTKPRKRPPIKYLPVVEDTPASYTSSTEDICMPSTPPERISRAEQSKAINKSPPKILNSLPMQRVVEPATRGRKRKMDNHLAPIVTVKSVTQKRGRYTRQETTKTLSLSIEPVNFNEM